MLERVRKFTARALMVMVATCAIAMMPGQPASASPGIDDYPAQWRNVAQDSVLDTWNEYNRECTSFVAWRLSSRNHYEMPFNAMAINWVSQAQSRNIPVDNTPAVGAVAWFNYGHVAWVQSVSADHLTVHIEEYNFDYMGNYHERDVAVSGVSSFIHFNDISTHHYHDDLAWYDGNALFGFKAPGFGVTTSVAGYAPPGWAGVGDYTHDGIDDVYWFDASTGSIYLIPGPMFTSAQLVRGPGVGAPVWAAAGDFSGDGYRDELAWYDGSSLMLLSRNGLQTVFSVAGYTPPTWASVADYNKDGKDDLFWYLGGSDGSIYALTSNGTGFNGASRVRGPGIGAPQSAAVGDLDGDGFRNDIAWYSGGVLFSFEGSSLATTSSITGYSPPDWMSAGDYNHDNKDDLYWHIGGSNGTIYVIPSNGPSFGGAFAVRGPGFGAPLWAATGDFSS